jgi:hypothetical protein
VKYFGKQLEEFRREQLYSKEIVLSDTLRGIPDSMIKHAENFAPEQKNRSIIPKPTRPMGIPISR